MSFLDSSVVSEFRIGKNVPPKEKLEFLLSTLAKFNLPLEDAFLTDRLFAEILGHGKIRFDIKKKNRENFDTERHKIVTLLSKEQNSYQQAIDSYIDFLHTLFSTELRALIPQESLKTATLDNLKTFPFIESFKSFEEKLNGYAEELFTQPLKYEKFIETLVEDSVVRYSLDAINIRSTAPKKHAKALDILGQIIKTLLIKYGHSEILFSNLNLIMSALKKHSDGTLTPQEKCQPLFRVDDDLVDPEIEHFSLYGRKTEERTLPVTVATTEPEKSVRERLKYAFQAIGTKAESLGNVDLLLGRIIIFDFNKLLYKEILVGDFINNNFLYESGKKIL